MKTLTTKALDNHGYQYPVTLTETANQFGEGKNDWVLHIVNTPGQWYMTTLEASPSRDRISIDFGQRWDCINFDAIMAEALTMLTGVDRITAAEVKKQDDAMWANLCR